MKIRTAVLLSLVVAIAATFTLPALAAPVHYGTGIHLWVLQCGPYSDGHYTNAYVSSSVCPNNPPPECRCSRTIHDFPYNHPYPTRIATSGGEGEDPGHVNVLIDAEGAIQCGIVADPPDQPYGTCGDPFLSTPAEEWEVEPEILNEIESLRPELEDALGGPVESISYSYAHPLAQQ
ncbi:MAG: hypothetical protein KDD11_15280 [Acidobacteria bacterium]|nr:hypothetical protein [Acidobacteriota bacterium]